MRHKELTDQIIKAFYKVYNTLGYGFLEKVYESAFAYELRQMGMQIKQQHPIKVYYDGQIMGNYFADLLVEDKIILELKCAEKIANSHLLQLRNYLNATDIEVGYVFNFGPKPTFQRRFLTNDRKSTLKNPVKSV